MTHKGLGVALRLLLQLLLLVLLQPTNSRAEHATGGDAGSHRDCFVCESGGGEVVRGMRLELFWRFEVQFSYDLRRRDRGAAIGQCCLGARVCLVTWSLGKRDVVRPGIFEPPDREFGRRSRPES